MSALSACSVAPLPAPLPASDAAATAVDSGAVGGTPANADSGTQESGDSASGATSFQKMMDQAQAADPAASGKASPATTAATPGKASNAGIDEVAEATAAATAAVTELLATEPLAQLLQLAGQGALAANTAAVTPPATGAARQAGSDRDADAAPQEDPLALVLASLAHLGVTLQAASAAAAANPAATDATATGTALAVAADSAAATLGNALPKSLTGAIDTLSSRLRPGVNTALPLAANSDGGAGATSLAGLLNAEPAAGNITLRDMLDGNGGDAASRVRDPAELAVTSRPADGTTTQAVAQGDSPRAAEFVTRTISVPVQHPRWAEAVSSQIRWFAEQGVQSATLRLTPEHLGPVEVRLSLADSQVTVNFTAAAAETRTALEQSLPRLRDMLAGAGLSLGEAQVQQQMRQGSQNQFQSGDAKADTDVRDALARVPMRLGLVDEYA